MSLGRHKLLPMGFIYSSYLIINVNLFLCELSMMFGDVKDIIFVNFQKAFDIVKWVHVSFNPNNLLQGHTWWRTGCTVQFLRFSMISFDCWWKKVDEYTNSPRLPQSHPQTNSNQSVLLSLDIAWAIKIFENKDQKRDVIKSLSLLEDRTMGAIS